MKKLLVLLALLPSLAFALSATPVQVAHGHATNGVCAVTLASSVTANDTIITFAGSAGAVNLTSVGDNLNSVTIVKAWTANGTPASSLGMYYIPTASSGSHTITYTLVSSANITCFAAEYPPVVLDQAGTINFVLTSTAVASNPITPLANGELLIFGFTQGGSSLTYGTYNNIFVQQDLENASGPSGAWASEIQATATSISGGATSSTAGTFGAEIASFEAAGSCTHNGLPKGGGAAAVPNGSSGSYWLKSGNWGTPNCTNTSYWSPQLGTWTTS